jgi:RNA polymerase sigma-B factor
VGGERRGRRAIAAPQRASALESSDLAKQELVRSHLPLVRSLARRYRGRGEDLEELVQVGALALVRASGRFDPDRGVAFASFAAPAVEGEIRRHLRDRPGREVSSGPGGPDAPERAAESAGDQESTRESEARVLLEGGLRGLEERERRIVFLRFHADMTERQIASTVGISQAQVSRLLDAALAKLRVELTQTTDAPAATDTADFRLISPDTGTTIEPVRVRRQRTDAMAQPGDGSAVDGGTRTPVDQPGAAEAPPSRRRSARSKAANGYSGRILVRMPSELHEQLALAAERDEVSLNRYVTQALSTSVDRAEAPAPRRAGPLKMAVLTNLAVVVLAAIEAVVLLVLALQRGL